MPSRRRPRSAGGGFLHGVWVGAAVSSWHWLWANDVSAAPNRLVGCAVIMGFEDGTTRPIALSFVWDEDATRWVLANAMAKKNTIPPPR